MKKMLLVGLLTIAGSVQAANWVHVADDNNGGVYFVDQNTIKNDSAYNSVTIWLKAEGGQSDYLGQKITSKTTQNIYSCKNRNYKITYGILYSYSKVVESGPLEMSNPVIPDTVNEIVYKAICTRPGFIITGNEKIDFNAIDEALGNVEPEQAPEDIEEKMRQATVVFLTRPENKLFRQDAYFNILTQEVLKIANTTAGSMMEPVDLLEAGRMNALKLIKNSNSTSKPSTPKKTKQVDKTSKSSVYL